MSTRIAFTESSSLTPTTLFAASGSLAVGDVVCQVSSADKTVAKADADNASARPPIGVVHEVRGTDVVVALNGEVASGLSGLTRGTAYWLSTTAGALVATKPATNAYIVGVAVSASEILVNTVAADLIIGGGGGSVTSFGVTSSDITVSNSPITSSGVIDLALNTVPVSKGGTGLTSATEQGASLIASSSSAYVAQATSLSWRNRIINGDMRVAQRGTAAVTVSGVVFPVDRCSAFKTTGWTGLVAVAQQSSDAPTGFSNSMIYTVTTGNAVPSADFTSIQQRIESANTVDFAWGTASARPITLSFWVKSSLAGKYTTSIYNGPLFNRTYITSITIASAGQWEKKTLTIPGDTSGTWGVDGSSFVQVNINLSLGSNYVRVSDGWQSGALYASTGQVDFASTTGRTFQITGLQLELGSVATPFEMLQYEKQLELCQRYYARLSSLSGNNVGFGAGMTYEGGAVAINAARVYMKYPQQMRAAPTITQSGTVVYNTAIRTLGSLALAFVGSDSAQVYLYTAANTQTVGQGVLWTGNSSTAYAELNAEL